MKQTFAVSLALCALILCLVVLGWISSQLDPIARAEAQQQAALRAAERVALAPLSIWLGRALRIAAIIGLIAAAAAAVAGAVTAWAGAARARNAAGLVYPQHGLYPAVVQPGAGSGLLLANSSAINLLPAPNERGSQVVAALTNGNLDRIPAGAMRPILRPTPDEALLPQPETAAVYLPAEQVVDVDPLTRPHWLIVGQTGSGKSTATRFIMRELAARNPVEFLICEPGGVDWNSQASATTETGIADCIDTTWRELERRQDLLRAEDVPHITALRQRPAYLYLVIEEMEAILDNLRDLDRNRATTARIELRNIARLGRKAGIGLIAVTQAARTDVFDSHVRGNLANILLFRNSQTTAEMFRLSNVRLSDLPTGQAYSVAHAGMIRFPQTGRPAVPISSLYREAVSPPVQDVVYRPEADVWQVNSGIPAVVPPAVPPEIPATIASVDELTPAMRRRIWNAYVRTRSLRGVERELWPDVQHGGGKFYVVREVVRSNPHAQIAED